jgi:hypothetical protein
VPFVRQTNFAAGELAPGLWGRTDLELYGKGLRRCRNFFIDKRGSAVSRPGTMFVREAKSQSGAVRLIPFVYSDTQSYALEFGNLYVRFHSNGATVMNPAAPAAPLEVATPYTAAQVGQLRWVQSGDVLTLTHPDHVPRTLSRASNTSWALATVSFTAPAGFNGLNDGFEVTDAALQEPLPVADPANGKPAQNWTWAATKLFRREDGTVYETAPFVITKSKSGGTLTGVPATIAVYPSRPVTLYLRWPSSASLVGVRVYRGRGQMFGWVGDLPPTATSNAFVDIGDAPDYTLSPPKGENPFAIKNPAGTIIRTEDPVACCYFEDRMVYGGTSERPGTLWLSGTGNYTDFDRREFPLDNGSLEYELAARQREEIRSIVARNRLVLLTSRSVWSFSGSGGEALTPATIPLAQVQAEIGANHLPPLLVDNAILFVRTLGAGVTALGYERDRDGFRATDLSSTANHLFSTAANLDHEIVDWTYSERPWGTAWAVRADGALVSLTLSDGGDVGWGVHEHGTGGHGFLAVCTVPEQMGDRVYAVVSGRNTKSIECFTSRELVGDSSDGICTDSTATWSTTYASMVSSGGVVSGLDYLEGEAVHLLAYMTLADINASKPRLFGPYIVTGGSITAAELLTELTEAEVADAPSQLQIHVGLAFTAELETLELASSDIRTKQKTVVSVGFEVDSARGLEAGQSTTAMTEWQARTGAMNYGGISAATQLVKVNVKGTWDQGARAVLRQANPYPVTVLGLTREVDLGG